MTATSTDRRVLTRPATLWTILLLGWVVSYGDRTLTGPSSPG